METSELGILWKKTRKQLPEHYWPNLHSTFDQTLRRKTCSKGSHMHSYYPQETYSLVDSKQFHFTLCKKWDKKMSSSKPSLSQFSSSVMYDSLRHHGLLHIRPPCPSPTPGTYSNSCLSRRWCHSTISSSVNPFSSYLQSFPASGSFPTSWFFTSGGQSVGVSFFPMNIQDWFPLGLTGLILQSKGLSRVFSNTTFKNINSLPLSFLYSPTLISIHVYWKNHSLD